MISDSKLKFIHGQITYSDFVVTVTNRDTFDWLEVELECAPAGDRYEGRFSYHLALIKAGQTVKIPIEKWLNKAGEDMPLVNAREGIVSVKCKTKDGFNGTRRAKFGSTYDPAAK